MKATQTPPSNQPLVEYEDFSFVAGKIITSTKHIYGRLKTIRAHTHLECITVEYERINKIEALCEEIDKKKRYAVSFEAQYIIYPTKKKSPLSLRTGTTRIRYWNFSESDFFKLNFLRSVHDKKLFLAHFSQSDLLFFIAAAFFHSEPRLSEAAYKQAVKYLSKENFSENDARAFLFYIRKILKGDAPKIATIIHTFQKVDTAALFTVYLLKLLARYSYFDLSLQKIFIRAYKTLLRKKAKGYSSVLLELFDFHTARSWNLVRIERFLWQVYLAATAERNVAALYQVWLRARKHHGDKETLHLIYGTWLGFTEIKKINHK